MENNMSLIHNSSVENVWSSRCVGMWEGSITERVFYVFVPLSAAVYS